MKDKINTLKKIIEDMGELAIAFSGGVDSTFLLAVAHEVLGDRCVAITLKLRGMVKEDLEFVSDFCQERKIKNIQIDIDELSIPGFSDNPVDRCYICKKAIFDAVVKAAGDQKIVHIADGSNADDVSDYRPGMKALKEKGVISPLIMAGITKSEVREYSKEMHLKTWDAPSSPCLSSRIPYGEEITEKKLQMVENAEAYIKSLGCKNCRVRTHGVDGSLARIEVDKSDADLILKHSNEITAELKAIGYIFVALDLSGFKSGSLNKTL